MKVIALNKKRNDEAVHPLRGLWSKQKSWFNKKDSDKEGYEKWQTEFKAERAKLDALAEKYEDEIYQNNKPGDLKVEVAPSTTPEPAKPAAKPPLKKARSQASDISAIPGRHAFGASVWDRRNLTSLALCAPCFAAT